jgi:hypothetical protein
MLILQNSLQELAAAGGPAVAIDAAWDAIACQMFSVMAYWTMCAPPYRGCSLICPRTLTPDLDSQINGHPEALVLANIERSSQ